MKVLFVSDRFPSDAARISSGTFKRMRTFLDALREKASVRLLLYCHYALACDTAKFAAAREFTKEAWGLTDKDLVICPEDEEIEYGSKIWEGYLARALSIHRQLSYVGTSGDAQLAALETCLEEQPDLIFAHRLPAACPLLRTKRRLPPIFFDLDDVEHKTFARAISHPPTWRSKRLFYLQVPALFWGERRAIKLSRKTFVCSDLDRRYLASTWGLSNVEVIPNSVPIPETRPLQKEPVLLFIGTYAYKPNALAAEELVTQIWPIVRAAHPTATLVIAGELPERIRTFKEQHEGVKYAGFVPDLDALYESVRVVCCPMRTGGGTRIKIIEAAAHGKPVVSTRIGAEGLHFKDGEEILLRDSARAFADACIQLLRDDQLCARMGQAARVKAVELYGRNNVIRRIQEEIFNHVT
jgi:glycosyltransferase involved in cell wall biosynthesis